MSSQPSSRKEAMVLNPLSPPKPPENLALHLQGGKVIFFTLNTLFDRDHATERGLEKCRQLNQDLRNKPMEELKRGYHGAMVAAYRQLLRSQVHGSAPRGFHPSSIPQVSVDKVGMLFQQLDLNPPPASERQLIGREFAGEFSRNRFEVRGASRCLGELKQLKYAIVVVDDVVEWDVVKHLNFWHYIDALITSADPTVRKPDSRVFQKALDVCRVSPKNAVIVGSSVNDDIVGIMEVSAEPILYNPSQNYALVEVKGRRVLVIRTMAELVSEIRSRPENRGLVQYQQQQLHPVPALPALPALPPMVYAPQDQGYLDDRNGEPSGQYPHGGPSQPQHPSSDPKPGYLDDGHVNQPRERSRPSPALSEPDSSDENPRSDELPKVQDRDRSIRDFERDVRPAPPLNRVPSKRRRDEPVIQGTSLPTNPQVPPRHDQGHLYYAAMGEYNSPARGSFHESILQATRSCIDGGALPHSDCYLGLHRIRPPKAMGFPARTTPGIRISSALGILDVTMRSRAVLTPPEINIKLKLQVRIKLRMSLDREPCLSKSDHRLVNAEPSDPARAFAAAGPFFFPNRPFPLPSHGFSNKTHPDRRAPSRAEAPEQREAGPSNQQPSSSRHEETAARGGRRAEMLMSCIMCSEVRPTLHGSASQSQFPDDAAARPSGQHQRTTPGLRVFAQSALDLGREAPRVSSSSKDVNEQPENMAGR
ncbi:hypothetical protein LZL87_012144 [Fusarium oxysporum]|nr:hypothetical protein LZL87_012144 [Fusarium oxysporum]